MRSTIPILMIVVLTSLVVALDPLQPIILDKGGFGRTITVNPYDVDYDENAMRFLDNPTSREFSLSRENYIVGDYACSTDAEVIQFYEMKDFDEIINIQFGNHKAVSAQIVRLSDYTRIKLIDQVSSGSPTANIAFTKPANTQVYAALYWCDSTEETTTCNDQDGGKNYYTRGRITYSENGVSGEEVDGCIDKNRVFEWFCAEGDFAGGEEFNCQSVDKVCEDGKCVEQDCGTSSRICIGPYIYDKDDCGESYIGDSNGGTCIYGCSNGVCNPKPDEPVDPNDPNQPGEKVTICDPVSTGSFCGPGRSKIMAVTVNQACEVKTESVPCDGWFGIPQACIGGDGFTNAGEVLPFCGLYGDTSKLCNTRYLTDPFCAYEASTDRRVLKRIQQKNDCSWNLVTIDANPNNWNCVAGQLISADAPPKDTYSEWACSDILIKDPNTVQETLYSPQLVRIKTDTAGQVTPEIERCASDELCKEGKCIPRGIEWCKQFGFTETGLGTYYTNPDIPNYCRDSKTPMTYRCVAATGAIETRVANEKGEQCDPGYTCQDEGICKVTPETCTKDITMSCKDGRTVVSQKCINGDLEVQDNPCGDTLPSCSDGVQNQGEVGKDCGGPCPPCEVDKCNNEKHDPATGEEGVDCGGPCPTKCTETSCTDQRLNGKETGVDCGGPVCPSCEEATCFDGKRNNQEEGVDCGTGCEKQCEQKDGCTDNECPDGTTCISKGFWGKAITLFLGTHYTCRDNSLNDEVCCIVQQEGTGSALQSVKTTREDCIERTDRWFSDEFEGIAEDVTDCRTDLFEAYASDDETQFCVNFPGPDKCYTRKTPITLDQIPGIETISDSDMLDAVYTNKFPVCRSDIMCVEQGECLMALNNDFYPDQYQIYQAFKKDIFNKQTGLDAVIKGRYNIPPAMFWKVLWSGEESSREQKLEQWGVCVYEERGLFGGLKRAIAELFNLTDPDTINIVFYSLIGGGVLLIIFLLRPPTPPSAPRRQF